MARVNADHGIYPFENIAGICNEGSNVLGMMPHPDRSSESLLGSSDGAEIFRSMITAPVVAR